jgi:phosphomannomutase/phosphoglucomutase
MELFGSSGTRGVANVELTPELAIDVARAAGAHWDADRVAIARDTRTTGPMLVAAVASGLTSVGVSAEQLGIVPTPGVQAHAEREGIPAIIVTASHNPPAYNGIKLVGTGGIELNVKELESLEAAVLGDDIDLAPWDTVGDVTRVEGVNRRYIEGVRAAIDSTAIEAADLTVALDPGNGAGTLTSPGFIRDLGCRVVTINAQPDGHFPGRDPEPVPDNLDGLMRLVRAADADLGIAHDGDADRAIFVDERGEYIEGDAALAALAAEELGAGDVTVSAVNVSQRLVDVVEDAGARLELTPIGSTRIMARIRELQTEGEHVPIAGEGNGGIIFPDYRLARDGAYIAAKFLQLVAERSASEVVADFDGYENVRINVEYDTAEERDRLLEAAQDYARSTDAELSTIDGYRLDFGDGWVLVRPSGTEPLIRIYAEARSAERAVTLSEQVQTRLESVE